MKVILEKNVPSLGKAGAVIEVSDGHARNFLLPQKLARLATDQAVSNMKQKQRQSQNNQAKETDRARSLANKLNQLTIELTGATSERQTLYGAINATVIAKRLADLGYAVDDQMIDLEHHIKQVGEYQITIRVGHDQVGRVKVVVRAE